MGNTNRLTSSGPDKKEKEEQAKRFKTATERNTEWKELARLEKDKYQNMEEFKSALAGENVEKNRYQSVLAPDCSRVKLKAMFGTSDYINASYVDGTWSNSKKAYIAAQAPKPETFKDFWRMVWEQNINTIVMLTNLEEKGKLKAHQYWPKSGTKTFGNFSVTLITSRENEHWSVREFTLRIGKGGLKSPTTGSKKMVPLGSTPKSWAPIPLPTQTLLQSPETTQASSLTETSISDHESTTTNTETSPTYTPSSSSKGSRGKSLKSAKSSNSRNPIEARVDIENTNLDNHQVNTELDTIPTSTPTTPSSSTTTSTSTSIPSSTPIPVPTPSSASIYTHDQFFEDDVRTVFQYHYMTWPDMYVPEPQPMLDMLKEIEERRHKMEKEWKEKKESTGSKRNEERKIDTQDRNEKSEEEKSEEKGKRRSEEDSDKEVGPKDDGDSEQDGCESPFPLLVHCSAGIGRTGTFCVIHSILNESKEQTLELENLSLRPFVSAMRDQRPGFIQQKCQYLFCYRVISFALTGRDEPPIEIEEKKRKGGKKKK